MEGFAGRAEHDRTRGNGPHVGVRIWGMGAGEDNFGCVLTQTMTCATGAAMVMPRCCRIQPV